MEINNIVTEGLSEKYEEKVIRFAHEYIDKGWWILICKPGNKEPHSLMRNGFKDATNNKDQIDI